ncbi:MAG: hypothetical protein AAB486_01225 [Patescibacteria group bacterium]
MSKPISNVRSPAFAEVIRFDEEVRRVVLSRGLEKGLPDLHQRFLDDGVAIRMAEETVLRLSKKGYSQSDHLPSRIAQGRYERYLERPLRVTANPSLVTPEQVVLMTNTVSLLEQTARKLRVVYRRDPQLFIPYIGQGKSLENDILLPYHYESVFPWAKLDVYWVEKNGKLWPQILDISSQCVTPFAFSAAHQGYCETVGLPLIEGAVPGISLAPGLERGMVMISTFQQCYQQWCHHRGVLAKPFPLIVQIVGDGNHGRAEHEILNRRLKETTWGNRAVIVHPGNITFSPEGNTLRALIGNENQMVDLVIRACVNRQPYHPDFPEKADEAAAMTALTEAQRVSAACVIPEIGNRTFDSKGWAFVIRAKRFESIMREVMETPSRLELLQSCFPECAHLYPGSLRPELEDGSTVTFDGANIKGYWRNWVFKSHDTSGSRGVDIPTSHDSNVRILSYFERAANSPAGGMAQKFVLPPSVRVLTWTERGIEELTARRKDVVYISNGQIIGWWSVNEEGNSYYIHGSSAASQSVALVMK